MYLFTTVVYPPLMRTSKDVKQKQIDMVWLSERSGFFHRIYGEEIATYRYLELFSSELLFVVMVN